MLKNGPPAVAPNSPKEPVKQESTLTESPQKYVTKEKVPSGYYVIVGSFKSLIQAQQNAAEIANKFNTNIIMLPPTPQGL